jgi:ABC-type amino acid transport system permease subunit
MWTIGCAILLATFSHAHWLAHLRDVRTRQLLGTPIYQLSLFTGLGLVCLGLFFLGQGWLERLVWAAIVILSAWQSWVLWQVSRR